MKSKIITLMILALIATLALAPPAHTAYEDSLVAYWKLDSQYSDSGKSYTPDAVGRLPGEVSGATLTTDATRGNVYSFWGPSLNRIIVNDNQTTPYLDIFGSNEASTVTFWAKKSPNIGAVGRVVAKVNYAPNSFATSSIDIMYHEYSGNNKYNVGSGYINTSTWTPVNYIGWDESLGLADNNWHQITAVRDSPAKVYVDGVDRTLNHYTSGTGFGYDANTGPAYPLVMGTYGLVNNTSWAFTGLIDDVAIWNRALDATEADAIYDFGVNMYSGVTGGLEDISLLSGYTSQERYDLTQLYYNQLAGPTVVTSDNIIWQYTGQTFSGRSYGEGWTENGIHYINLGSGLTGGPVPEPATVMSVFGGIFMLGLRRVFKRK